MRAQTLHVALSSFLSIGLLLSYMHEGSSGQTHLVYTLKRLADRLTVFMVGGGDRQNTLLDDRVRDRFRRLNIVIRRLRYTLFFFIWASKSTQEPLLL